MERSGRPPRERATSASSDVPDLAAAVAPGRDGAVLRVRVRPRSRRRGVLGVTGGELVVGVGSAAEKGRANAEALRELARWLGVSPSRLTLVSGATSRSKRVAAGGYDALSLRSRIADLLGLDPS